MKSLSEQNCPGKEAGDFSWSHSRRKLFNFCKRAYYYHYYGASGGWDNYASETTRKLYRLKNIRSAENWAGEVFAEAVHQVFMQRRPRQYPNYQAVEKLLSRKIQQLFHKGNCDVICEQWRDDAKAVNLFEVYYGDFDKKEEKVLEYVKQRLAQLLYQFVNHNLFKALCELDNIVFKNFKLPVGFEIGDLEVWTAPTLIWQDEDRLKVLAVRNGNAGSQQEIRFMADLFTIMANQRFKYHSEAIDAVFYFTGPPNSQPEMLMAPSNTEQQESVKAISASADEMLKLIYPDGTVCEDDFPGWLVAADQICSGCRFKGHCRK